MPIVNAVHDSVMYLEAFLDGTIRSADADVVTQSHVSRPGTQEVQDAGLKVTSHDVNTGNKKTYSL